jgi:hypothetical protein
MILINKQQFFFNGGEFFLSVNITSNKLLTYFLETFTFGNCEITGFINQLSKNMEHLLYFYVSLIL